MVCKPCGTEVGEDITGNDLEFTKVLADKSVPAGQTWHIYADIWNNSFFIGDDGRVCIYEGDNVIAQSERFHLAPDKTVRIALSGKMPDRDLYLGVSLVREKLGFTRCEDGHTVFIKKGTSDLVNPADEPIEDKESLGEWVQDNLVLVLTLVLVIIALMKFG